MNDVRQDCNPTGPFFTENQRLEAPSSVRVAAVSPDQSAIACVCQSEICVADTAGNRWRFTIPAPSVTAVAWSPDSRRFITADDQLVQVWDGRSGKRLAQFNGNTDRIAGVAMSERLAATAADDGSVCVWRDGRQRFRFLPADGFAATQHAPQRNDSSRSASGTLLPRAAAMHCVALTTDGGHLAAGDDDGIVWIWNTETGAPVHRLNAHLAPVHDVQWSADGKRLGSVSAVGEVRLWDLATGRQTLSVRAGGGKVTPRLTAHQNRDASAQFGFGSAPGGFFVALYDKVTWFPAP